MERKQRFPLRQAASRIGGALQRVIARGVELLAGRPASCTMGVPLNLPKDASILDVGCGDGWFLLALRSQAHANLWGLDVSDHARDRLVRAGVRMHVGDLFAAPLPERHFDLIRMEHVLEHLPKPFESLQVLHSLLKPGGFLVLNLPNIDSLSFRLLGPNFASLDLPRHFYHYTPTSLYRLAERSGFRVQELRTAGIWQVFALSASSHFKLQGRRFAAKLLRHPVMKIFSPLYGALVTWLGKGDSLSAVLVVDQPVNLVED